MGVIKNYELSEDRDKAPRPGTIKKTSAPARIIKATSPPLNLARVVKISWEGTRRARLTYWLVAPITITEDKLAFNNPFL